MVLELAPSVWRDFALSGVPASGRHEPDKSKIRAWGTWVERMIAAFTSNGGLVYATKAAMDADLLHAVHVSAWVVDDPVAANNGIYEKLGASGAGSWNRLADLPYSFIACDDAGAGTANAIQMTSSIPAPVSPGAALFIGNIFEANTTAVTLSLNGAPAKPLVSNSGNPLLSGYLAAGMRISFIDDGASYRLISDVASAAIQAAAEAAALDAAASAASVAKRRFATVAAAAAFLAIGGYPDLVETEVYGANNAGGAAYVKRVSEPAHPGKFLMNGTTWYELSPYQEVSPYTFGAPNDGGTTDGKAAIDAFALFTATFAVARASIEGIWGTSGNLWLGSQTGKSETRTYYGTMRIKALNAISGTVLTIGNAVADQAYNMTINGRIDVTGTGGVDPATRTCDHLIRLKNVIIKTQGLRGRYCLGYGLIADGVVGSSFIIGADFGQLDFLDCGTMYDGVGDTDIGLTSTFTSTDTGSSGVFTQRSELVVATPPPSWILTEGINTQQHFIKFAGQFYFIHSYNSGTQTLSVHPWLPAGTTSGTLHYCVGGGVYLKGGDAAGALFGRVSSTRCATGVGLASLYGPVMLNPITQSCSIGFALGNAPDGGILGGAVIGAYFEGNGIDVLKVPRAGPPNFQTYFSTTIALNLVKCVSIAASRLTGGAMSSAYNHMEGIEGLYGPGSKYKQLPNNGQAASNPVTFALNYEHTVEHYHRTSGAAFTVNLAQVAGLNAAYGWDDGVAFFTGIGANNKPTYDIVFDPPTGESINALAVDATFTIPAASLFAIAMIKIKKIVGGVWLVTLVYGDTPKMLSGSATFDPPSVGADVIGPGDETTVDITVNGAAVGDIVVGISFSLVVDLDISARLIATNTARAKFRNNSGAAIDPASGTVRILVADVT